MSLILLFLVLLHLSLSSVVALPFYTPPAVPTGYQLATLQPSPLLPSTANSYTVPRRVYWYWKIPYHPIRANQSNGPFQLPHFHSGPWDLAWQSYNNLIEKAKIFKRGLPSPSAQERIAQHLRPNTWWQRIKDVWARVRGKRLKVTRTQVQEVKDKYKYVKYTNRASNMQTKNSRIGTAFVSQPGYGLGRSRAKASWFGF
ncbi:uncharacterized protein SRS1_10906 [Sporisorium reilianum f. sp. reilianum]|uniref:Uncharacterized protein n=1 Tax=Sporisorium reilianum f. sp. reilianum TaxID=72559 RepID=A0A2N8UNX3_9BASI|nr:uncharacterized protein SRS1_10906 [Sporisorium reilianum f. sp. reilianum]